jgi:hypothetical protein
VLPSARRGEPIPPVLEAAILKCLEKDPKNRFVTGDDLANALRADRAVALATPRYPQKPKSRALQMVPAFMMVAAAAVLHFAPKPEHANAAAAPVAQRTAAAPPAPAPPLAPAATAKAPAPAPSTIDIALTSSPDGAQLFKGEESLGEAPQVITIPMSGETVTFTAKFADGSEVVQKIVPDRPLPQIAFIQPAQKASQPVAKTLPTKKVGKAPTGTQKTTTSAGTMTGGRDGTMDPFK